MAIAAFVVLGLVGFFVMSDSRYLWLKALHIIAVISWMAGMVYLPRIFVYHSDAEVDGEAARTFQIMERRLMKIIMTPAMIVSWILGLWLAAEGGHLTEVWFLIKLILVIGMTVTHFWLAGNIGKFERNENTLIARQWRMANEIPTVLMIAIVILVVLKPL